jgi:malate dehydrogenase (oxaloacetate-decarboxylating)/malate dehydrogenase (oxaloacetate-decarboxylating)(NADP+)
MIPVCKTDKENALNYHRSHRPGKLEIKPTVPFATQCDMSLAYTPGVAHACLEIANEPHTAYSYTTKGNLVAVVSNGTAVLGLGDIGALASKPVMEGKAILFKSFANLDAFDIEVDETDIDKFCDVVAAIAPTFGGINLEDIKAPECFEIEKRLVERLNIPVMHDDQHGTAVISAAGMINACLLTERKIEDLKIVIVGAGAAAIMCGRMYKLLGAKDITLIDSTGVVHDGRDDLNKYKAMFAIERDLTQDETFEGADMVVGLSRHGTISKENIAVMAKNPIIFTLANPTPEIYPEEVKKVREDAIIATGRTDYPNQVNNVLGFPFIFRGAIDVHATQINDAMKVAAAQALATLARKEVPEELQAMYNEPFSFSKEYIIPKPFDKRLLVEVASAVAKAAYESGATNIERCDIPVYEEILRSYVS